VAFFGANTTGIEKIAGKEFEKWREDRAVPHVDKVQNATSAN
jgi:hypothetical protein